MQSTRRKFLQTSLLAALNLYASTRGRAEQIRAPLKKCFGSFYELAPGAVAPAGWLQLYLERQAERLAFALPDVSWPFTDPYWAGKEENSSWWPWEQNAYWIDGATRCALVTGNAALMQRTMLRIQYTLGHRDGVFLGPQVLRDGTDPYHRWPHAIFFRALAALSDNGAIRDVPEILSAFYLAEPHEYFSIRNVVNIETMLWCYARTGDSRLLALAVESWESYVDKNSQESADLNRAAVYGGGPINAHGVTYAEISKLPAILYSHTGNAEYLRFALAAQQRIFDHHLLVDGIPSSTEYFRTTTSIDSHETCDITDHTWTWGYLLMATGDGIWADRIERACFNAGMGAIRKDWRGLQYFSCPNQVLATLTSNHNVLKRGNEWMAYQPNPGRRTACCGGNIHRLFPNYVLRMWMTTSDDGVAAVLYGPSTVEAKVGTYRELIRIEQQTNYPFEEKIRFTIRCHRPIDFPVYLRIPRWCASPLLELNGKRLRVPKPTLGFLTVKMRFRPNDVLTLYLPMRVAAVPAPQDGVSYECGPLVYSYAIAAEHISSVEPQWSTAEYPIWITKPRAAWNYGVPPQRVPSLIRTTSSVDPWTNPPSYIEIKAQQVDGWVEAEAAVPGGDGLTPGLPETRTSTAPLRTIRLMPYGATDLRITIFPLIS